MNIAKRLWLVPLVGATSLSTAAADPAAPRVAVVRGREAPPLEVYAAEQLCQYLHRLFGVKSRPATKISSRAEVLLLVGTPQTNPFVEQALGSQPLPTLSDQGVVLRRTEVDKRPALLLTGGSPAATLWAVYALAEHWGVRYLLHDDVLPPQRPFELPQVDLLQEPIQRTRQWRVVNDFPLGPESWGMDDYRPVVDQLAKLRFNRLLFCTYTYQPFLDLEVRGVRRQQAHLWFNYHYPITPDMVGRELYGNATEFWNPDLPPSTDYAAFVAAGQRLIHRLMAQARARGMQCAITATLTEFPPEFASLLKGAQKVQQLGEMGIVPGPETDIDDPVLAELAGAVLKATVNTYPEADFVVLSMPEFRQWSSLYERAWQALDRKYALAQTRPLDEVLAAARQRQDYPGGTERAMQEVKGDIVALYFYDRLLTELKVLEGTRRPDMRFVFCDVAEELLPVLGRLLPPGGEILSAVDYTPSRILKRRRVLAQAPSREVPCGLIHTLHDDNVGLLPQLATGSIAELTRDLQRYGWAGFSTRYWLTGDHDPCVAYLAKAAWERDLTPETVYRDQLRAACGEACVAEMLTVFREVEATTVALEWHGLGLTFPVPGMVMKHWTPEPLSPELAQDREGYVRALAAARRAQITAGGPGCAYIDYWVGRLEFAIGFFDTVTTVRHAAMAEAAGRTRAALEQTQTALASARTALAAYARVVRDQSDRGAIAVLNEYVYRPLQAKAKELQAKDAAEAPAAEPAALAAARRTAQQRSRRLIYNNDGNEVMFAGTGTPAGFLANRFGPILNTQVESVFYCTGVTTVYSHEAKVGETFGEFCLESSGDMAVLLRNNIRALQQTGHDPLELAIAFCRQNRLEIFFSHRINDIHDSVPQWDYLLSRWKREHPECLLGPGVSATRDHEMNSPRYWWSALDFEKPQVLDYLYRIQEDVCRRYDLDGVEIDYFRSPLFFRPNLDFQPATAAQVNMLTDFQRRLRELTLKVGTERGRPLLMAVRVPATLATCRHVGIDLERWLDEGLADLLILGGGYVPFTEPLAELVQLGHRYRLPVYATISASGMRGREQRYGSVEAWRGAAANAWQAGVDGVYAFNLFPDGPEPRFLEIGSPETLKGRDKLFVIDNERVLEGSLAQGIEQTQALPLSIPSGGALRVARLPIGDDLADAARNGALKSADLRVQITPPEASSTVAVRLNGAALTPVATDRDTGWLTFTPPADLYRCGANEISLRRLASTAATATAVDVTAVEVQACYR